MDQHDIAAQLDVSKHDTIETTLSQLQCNDLPSNWRTVNLGDVVKDFISGGTPSTKRQELWDGSIPWTTSASIAESDLFLDNAQRFITEQGLQESASHLVPKGNLLVGTRVGVGKAVVNLIDVAISQDLTGVVVDSTQVGPEFVAYQFKTERIQSIFAGSKRGTTIKGISRFDLQMLVLYVPPMSEQHAIAQVLRTAQKAIQTRRRELELERERKAALMDYLFTYGTTSMNRVATVSLKETEVGLIPTYWDVVQFDEIIASGPKNGLYKPQSFYGQGTPIVRINDFSNDGDIVTNTLSRVYLSPAEIEEYHLDTNDILVNRVNSLSHLGKIALIGTLIEPTVFESNMMRLSVDTRKALPQFVFRFLNSSVTRQQIRGKARRAVAQSSINQNDVKSIIVFLPTLYEQQEIMSILDLCNTKIAALEQETAVLEELFQALLEELMTGRLSTIPLIETENV